jgi:hypothetical protein
LHEEIEPLLNTASKLKCFPQPFSLDNLPASSSPRMPAPAVAAPRPQSVLKVSPSVSTLKQSPPAPVQSPTNPRQAAFVMPSSQQPTQVKSLAAIPAQQHYSQVPLNLKKDFPITMWLFPG